MVAEAAAVAVVMVDSVVVIVVAAVVASVVVAVVASVVSLASMLLPVLSLRICGCFCLSS